MAQTTRDLSTFVYRVRQSWRSITLIVVLAMFLAAAYSLLVDERFEASIVLIPSSSESVAPQGLSQVLAASGLGGEYTGDLRVHYSRLATSRTLLSEVAGMKYETTQRAEPRDLYDIFELSRIPEQHRAQAVTEFLNKSVVSVRSELHTGALILKVTTTDPLLSAEIANNIATELDEYARSVRSEAASRQLRFVRQRRAEVADSLLTAEQSLLDFREKNRAIANSPELQTTERRLERSLRSLEVIHEELGRQEELARIQEIRDSPQLMIIDRAAPPLERSFPRRGRIVLLTGLVALFTTTISIVLLSTINDDA